MTLDTQISKLTEMTEAMLAEDSAFFLVDLRIKPTNNIKVFVDGDQGIAIDKLIYFNRKLYKEVEAAGMYPEGEFSLEVSSPGLDEPLKIVRQYLKNKGRAVEVLMNDGQKFEGTLVEVSETEIVIEEEKKAKGKKKDVSQIEPVVHTLSLADIKTTKIQIKF